METTIFVIIGKPRNCLYSDRSGQDSSSSIVLARVNHQLIQWKYEKYKMSSQQDGLTLDATRLHLTLKQPTQNSAWTVIHFILQSVPRNMDRTGTPQPSGSGSGSGSASTSKTSMWSDILRSADRQNTLGRKNLLILCTSFHFKYSRSSG